MDLGAPKIVLLLLGLILAVISGGAEGCNMNTKEVGVCLHVYLERDFLSLEGIVYPRENAIRKELYDNYAQSLQLPPLDLPDLDRRKREKGDNNREERKEMEKPKVIRGRHQHLLQKEGNSWRRKRKTSSSQNVVLVADNYAVIDAYGRHGWVEGPELEDYCSRLETVLRCFEDVLVSCDSGKDFFRYRHLLHSLEKVHKYLCKTVDDRSSKFLPFLKVIDCAEKARLQKTSCQRPNVTENVWNQILRLETGPELCDSLNTQRSCLLENEYVQQECGGPEKEELYRNVSGVFLATWCRLPIHPHLLPYVGDSSRPQPAVTSLILLLLLSLALLNW